MLFVVFMLLDLWVSSNTFVDLKGFLLQTQVEKKASTDVFTAEMDRLICHTAN